MKNKFQRAGLLMNDLLRERTNNLLDKKNADLFEDLKDVDPKEIFAALNGDGRKNKFNHPYSSHFPLIYVTAGKSIEEHIEEMETKNNIRNLIIDAVTAEAEECEQMDEKQTLEYLRSGFKFNSEDAVEICLCLNLFNDDFTQDILLASFNAQQQQKKIFSEIEMLDAADTKRKI